MKIINKMQYFGLCSAAAMYHAMYLFAIRIQDGFNNRRVGARRGKHQFACLNSISITDADRVSQTLTA